MNIAISEITSVQTHEVRWPVLRNGLPKSTCEFKGDDLSTTIHLGAFHKGRLTGVLTLLKKEKNAIKEIFPLANSMYQLRGMGVLEDYQGLGIGAQLMRAAQSHLKEMQVEVIWFHARTSALGFYKKMGYQVIGEELQLEPAGPHFKMAKEL